MATKVWRGDATPVAGVTKGTIGGTLEVGDLFVHTIDGIAATYPAATTVIATERTALIAWWNALDPTQYPRHAEIVASAGSGAGEILFTDRTAGTPSIASLVLTTTESDGGAADSQTYVQAGVTTATGPNFADNADNWEGGLPSGTDTAIVDGGASLLFGLTAFEGLSLTWDFRPGFEGGVGLPRFNGSYLEHRATRLQVGGTVNIRCPKALYLYLDHTDVATTFNVNDGPRAAADGTPGILLIGNENTSVANLLRGSFGLAYWPAEELDLAILRQSFVDNVGGDTEVWGGAGLTLAAVEKSGGLLVLENGASGAVVNHAGDLVLNGGSLSGPDIRGGTLVYNSTGTLGGATIIGPAGFIDFSRDMRAKTVTNPIDVYRGLDQVIDPFGVVSNLRVDCNYCEAHPNVRLGTNYRWTRGAVS